MVLGSRFWFLGFLIDPVQGSRFGFWFWVWVLNPSSQFGFPDLQ